MANLIKKIEFGNPLINLGLHGLYEEHQLATGDERLAKFYHRLLTCTEGSPTATRISFAMIDFSVGVDTTMVMETIMDHLNGYEI